MTANGSSGIRAHNHLVRKQTLNHLAKPSQTQPVSQNDHLQTKWLWVPILLLSLKL